MHDTSHSSPLERLSPEQQERLAELLDGYLSSREEVVAPDVEAMLARHPDLAEAFRASLRGLEFLDRAAGQMSAPRPPERSAVAPPRHSARQLGDFLLIREVGRGGMGIVYLARQISLDRRVALKVLPFAAVLDQKQITRFENEARAAAQLHHPNIVPVFSVGCERGVHYYAMQYVEGGSLELALAQLRASDRAASGHPAPGGDAPTEADSACRPSDGSQGRHSTLRAFTTAESAQGRPYDRTVCRLGIQAAEALQHAHDCGIVHRDVKPSNLLLDRDGKVWVTDFGLARFQTAEAGLTSTGQVLGSIRYMSPEQAAGRSNLLDQRTDVYSLGITLYEALTLRPAFDGDDRADLLRRIGEEEPLAPRRIRPSIAVDLETIVLKAISKSPEARYQSAQEFADDLRRFLDGKPALARRPTLLDHAGKWTRRHAKLVAAGACAAAALAIVLAASTMMIAAAHGRTKAALEESERNRARAETHFRQAREVVDRFGARLAEQLAGVPGAETVRSELLRDTLDYYRAFAEYAGGDETLRADLAFTYFKAGKITERIGSRAGALDEYRKAQAALEDLARSDPRSERFRAELALCHNDIGLLLGAEGKVAEAIGALETAVAIQRELVARRPQSPRLRGDLALTLGNLGLIGHQAGDLAEAETRFREAVEIQQALVDENPDELRFQSALAVTCNNLSFVYRGSDAGRAVEACQTALKIQQRLVEAAPAAIDYQGDLALSYNNLGTLHGERGDTKAAIEAYRRAAEIRRQLVRKAPSVIRFRADVAVSCNNLGRLYSEAGDQEAARGPLDEAIGLFEQLVSDYPGELNYRSCLGGALNNRAMASERLGHLAAAEADFRAAIEHQRLAFEGAPEIARFRQFLSNHYWNLGQFLKRQGRAREALEIALERKRLWLGDAERLFGVAVELAAAAAAEGGEQVEPDQRQNAEWADQVVLALEEAVAAGFGDAGRVRSQPEFDLVRGHPRFKQILEAIDSGIESAGAEGGAGQQMASTNKQATS